MTTSTSNSQFDDANDDNGGDQGGFSSDEDGVDVYASAQRRLKSGSASAGAKATAASMTASESNDVYNVNEQVSVQSWRGVEEVELGIQIPSHHSLWITHKEEGGELERHRRA